MSSIGLIVIGNEILNGQVKDENSFLIAKSLPILGLKLAKISVIADDIEAISAEVSLFSRSYDHVITSGGIGPTHDDVTFEAVALAFNEPLHQHPELTKKLMNFFDMHKGTNGVIDPRLRLARIPLSSKLTYGVDIATGMQIPYPVISRSNVTILPGIPSLFKKGFDIIKESLMSDSRRLIRDAVYFSKEESKLTDDLNIVVKEFDKSVLFGSYPVLDNNFYKVKITMESEDPEQIASASSRLKSLIGEANISNYDPMVIKNAAEQVYRLARQETDLGRKVRATLATIEEAFRRYRRHELAIAFTGGKDCTALLHLIYAHLNRNPQSPSPMISLFFVRTRPSFAEVEQFIGSSLRNYEVVPPRSNFLEYNGPMRDSLWRMSTEHRDLRAIFMGTKSTDPNGKQDPFTKTTDGWPDYCLVNPLLDWTYRDVWRFLLDLSVPYCTLYDKGYTSLGGMDNTLPNEKLLYSDPAGVLKYRPAYLLEDEDSERIGRQSTKK